MSNRSDPPVTDETLIREGDAWVVLLTSGGATHADADAVLRWRRRSPAHEAAFREAVRLRNLVRQVATELREVETAAAADASDAIDEPQRAAARSKGISRRAVLTGAIAASATGVALLAGGRATGLWLPGSEQADFATDKGQRLVIALGAGISAELNTLTQLTRRPKVAAHGVELLSGEVMLTAALPPDNPLIVLAGAGRASAHSARFGLRCMGAQVAVTCFEGTVSVEVGATRRALPPDHRLVYDRDNVGEPALIDPAVATAWRRGMLVFRQEPLSAVVAEINRYRPGRVMIADDELARRRVDGTFYVAQLDQFFDQVRSAFGARVTRLPGGIVVIA